MKGAPRALLAAGIILAVCAGGAGVIAIAGEGDGSAARTERWSALRPAGLERTEVAAARVGRHVYVVGGFERRSGQTTAAVERYDIRRDSWRRVASMPIGLNHPTIAAVRGRLYVHGGYAARRDLSSASAALLEYNPSRNRWRRLRSSPTPRAAHALAAIGDRLYAAGGANESGSVSSLEVYDIGERRWRRGPSFPGPARNHTTGVASGGLFYVLAGRDSRNFTAAERYDPRRRRWSRLPSLRTARGGIASTRLADGRIVVFGGEQLGPGGTTIRQVELYDPRRRRWSSLPDMLTPRHGLAGVALGRRVFSFQGGERPGFFFSSATEFLDVPSR